MLSENTNAEAAGKWCTMCGEFLPYENFHADATTSDGYKNQCRDCRAAHHAEEQAAGLDPRLAAIEEEALDTLETLTPGGTYTPNSHEMMESLLRPFGGLEGFSKVAYASFWASPPGSARRLKFIEAIVSLSKFNTQHLDEGSFADMSDADLRRLMVNSLKDYQTKNGLPSYAVPSVIDVKPRKPVPAEATPDFDLFG